jgi:hypothetical protein
MGVDYNTFIGPFVEVHNPPIPAKETLRTCSNVGCHQHKRYQSGEFCSSCGTKIGDVTFDSLAPIRVDYVEFGDAIVRIQREYKPDNCKDYDIWIDNHNGSPGVRYDTHDSLYVESVTHERIVNEVNALLKRRELQINRLKEIFGEYAVQVKWGVVADAS